MLLFASEIAACIGRHKYQSSDAALIKVWQRVSPDTYKTALQRCKVTLKDAHTVVDELKVDVSDATTCGHKRAREALIKVMDTPLQKANEVTVLAAQAVLDHSASKEEKKQDMINICNPTCAKIDANTEEKISAAVDTIVKQHAEGADVRSLLKQVIEMPVVKNCPEAEKAVQFVVYTARGTAEEDSAVKAYGSTVTSRNDKFFKDVLVCSQEELMHWSDSKQQTGFEVDQDLLLASTSVKIGGRVDGISEGKLVEVKCRQNRIFKYLPDYEFVQITCLMHLTKLPVCDLVQKLGDKVQVTQYTFDEKKWYDIKLGCIHFAQQVQMLLRHIWIQNQVLQRV
jgi:hypothetical protein